ncbi:hypothetical protein NDU88_000288 [Pleurodeles waltl]|uniref:Uncharacterized protein n=1 Tax=Pleurodeles waltl TaxID=8319 RepID=A0AAV7S9N6_PLEWA|nr:hypothetical protein NDU88_000288 [Pleurodeles waltl]
MVPTPSNEICEVVVNFSPTLTRERSGRPPLKSGTCDEQHQPCTRPGRPVNCRAQAREADATEFTNHKGNIDPKAI